MLQQLNSTSTTAEKTAGVPGRTSLVRTVAGILVGVLGFLAVSSWHAPTADGRKKRKPAAETVDSQQLSSTSIAVGAANSSEKGKSVTSKPRKSGEVLVFPGAGKRVQTPSTNVSKNVPNPEPTLVASARPAGSSALNSKTTAKSNRGDPRLRAIGFRSRAKLEQHYEKHGREFGNVSLEEYLAMAQDLRDAPLSGRVLEANQAGGTISRFDRKTGAFTAFDRDLTIRTFFKPNGGEAYFRRAATKTH